MSVSFSGFLNSGANQTGQSLLVGVGDTSRYNPIQPSALHQFGLYQNVQSLELFTTDEATGCLILLTNDDFSGGFGEVCDVASAGQEVFNCSGPISSVLLVATQRKGRQETRLSFRDQFLTQWNTFLDSKLAGTRGSRHGDPLLTWEMFPANVSYLDPALTYLKIYQPLDFELPWPYDHYSASMTYHIELFVDNNSHLRCWGARWAYWVQGGAKSGHIADSLKPAVADGLTALQDQLNQTLAGLDALGPVNDVYYLPGSQIQPVSVLIGNTADDVTIVVEH